MKILSRAQLQQTDLKTIEKQNITSWELMERASYRVFLWLKENTSKEKQYIVYAGIGNNGGDGLAIARMLFHSGRKVKIRLLYFGGNPSEDFLTNLKKVEASHIEIEKITSEDEHQPVDDNAVVIDAIFGVGLTRPAPLWVQHIFEQINVSGAFVVSIDMPSGMYVDKELPKDVICIKPDEVLTFQSPKLTFLLPETGKLINNWTAIDIGLDQEFIKTIDTPLLYITSDDITKIYKPREKFSHKGTYGHALMVAGSYGKIGAAILSGKATLRAGAGLLTLVVPKCGYEIVQTALPEAMVITPHHKKHLVSFSLPFTPTTIGIGPGLGTHKQTAKALFECFENYANLPFVIDADALNILSSHKDKLNLLPQNAILTPHPKELERSIGQWISDFEKIEKTKKFAKKYQIILIIKGAHTMITNGDEVWFNSTGNPGMATAGSGDVLTGILTGLLSQGYTAMQSAILGVYVHGKSGDISTNTTGKEGVMASDLVNNLRMVL